MSETAAHNILKWKALEWLYIYQGCKIVATEVKIGKYIFDAVGCDGSRVFIVEAKQDEKDYLKDCNKLDEIRQHIDEYRKLLIETADSKKYLKLMKREKSKSYKFYDKALLKLSTFRYIIASDDVIKQIPEDWGLITEHFQIIKKCDGTRIEPQIAHKVMHNIGIKQVKYYLEHNGVKFGKVIDFPKYDE